MTWLSAKSRKIGDANPIKGKQNIAQVASISANNDMEIGEEIALAMDKVGKDGVITVEESKTAETSTDFVEGMQFDRGYISPYFCNNRDNMTAAMNDALILIHDKKISNMKDLLPVLEQVAQQNKQLLIIAEDIDGEASCYPGGQLASWNPPGLRRQGTWLWGSTQGHA